MARIRTIKPEFFTSLTIADLTPEQRLTFIGLWTHVDDDGRCVDDPRLIKAAVWPLDDRVAKEVEDDLRALQDASLIVRYQASGRRYLAVRNWREHQRIDKPKPSKLPAPDDGTPMPPGPPGGDPGEPPASDDVGFQDEYENDPGDIQDASETHPGHVHVGREQGTGKGNRERKGSLPGESVVSPDARGDQEPLPDRMTAEWWRRYSRGTAQSKHTVRATITQALDNGLDAGELWTALVQLAETSHPVTAGCLQVALAEVRKRAIPPRGTSNVIDLASGQTLPGTDATVAGWAAVAASLDTGDPA